jgi:hypothetical protein
VLRVEAQVRWSGRVMARHTVVPLTHSAWLVNHSLPVSTLALTCATCRSPPATLIRVPRCGPERARGSLDRHATYIVAALHGLRHLTKPAPPSA